MRHSVRARLLPTLLCAASVLALPAGASASNSSPVHVDPSSPVAKEYALPLATARGAPPESGKNGSLFGSGIKHGAAGTPKTQQTTTSQAPPVQTAPPVQATPPVQTETAPALTTTTATQTTTTPRPHPEHVTTVTLPDLVTTPTRAGTAPVTANAAPAAYKVLKPGSGSGLLWMVLAAAFVVAIGSAGGIALSRRR
jgi:hypothetical protein